MPLTLRLALPALALLALAAPASAAPPVPANIPYQGVLLDDQGQPRSGTVDLTFRIYDSILGGNLVYKEEILGVPLVDGVFTVELGPSGNPTDTPVDPLTTDIVTALAGDLAGTGASRFIAVQVGSATPGSRNPILSVPYALRADSAETADVATTALVAQESQSFGGFDPLILSAVVDNWNDDGGPPGSDPSEGTADTDGDGTPNFADSDNDDDGISDSVETSNGSDINLVTPTVAAIDPDELSAVSATPGVVVTGTNFDAAMTAVAGGFSITPANVTASSFETTVPPLPPGTSTLSVTLPNGETGALSGLTVDVPDPIATGLVQLAGNLPVNLAFRSNNQAVASSSPRIARDVNPGNGVDFPGTTTVVPGNSKRAVTVDPSDRPAALTCITSSCNVQIIFDDDNNGLLGQAGEQAIPIETVGGVATGIRANAIAWDATGRVAGAYIRENNLARTAVLVQDLNDDEVFQANEIVPIQVVTGITNNFGDLAFDASNRVNYAFADVGADEIRIAADLNADGDTADAGENEVVVSIASGNDPSCLGLTADTSGNLALVWSDSGASTIEFLWDGNGDRDFDDAGESFSFPTSLSSVGCDIAANPAGGVVIAHSGDDIRVINDRNGDRDFDDGAEQLLVGRLGGGDPVAVGLDVNGLAHVTSSVGLFVDFNPAP